MQLIRSLYTWIIVALISGALFGLVAPQHAIAFEPLATGFIKLIKLFIGPIIFLTVVTGIAQSGSASKLGKVGLQAFIYFEIVSTLALLLGWLTAVVLKPGASLHVDATNLNAASVLQATHGGKPQTFVDFLQNLIPKDILSPFMNGDILQILVLAVLFGTALLILGKKKNQRLLEVLQIMTASLFKIIKMIMYAAPFGVFGAMAYTIAKFGGAYFVTLLKLILTFYVAGGLFIFVALNIIASLAGFSLWQFLKYIAGELLLVLGTSSSESALPQLIEKLENLGCEKETVGLVVPIGYSFNLDGTNIYITLAALFIAQALGIELTFMQELALFLTAMVSSKGAAGVTGAGFITLAATLAAVPTIPVTGMILILGIDRFMSEGRSLINFIGNGVAAIVISRLENEMSAKALQKRLVELG